MATFAAAQISEFFIEISTWPTQKLLTISALLGITSHVTFFAHGELDYIADRIFMGFLLTPASIFAVFFFHLDISFWKSFITTATIWTSFLSGLTVSILTYRLFFHPLRKFPGPVMARTTKWWGAMKTMNSYHLHYVIDDLHQKYGDFVRTGPNELSISSEAAVALVVKCDKGPLYNLALPDAGMMLTRDREIHRMGRRIWDRAFTNSALRQYLPGIITRSNELLSLIETNKPVNITEYIDNYMWDSMGQVVFSKSFDILSSHGKSENNYYMNISRTTQATASVFIHVPYMPMIFDLIPFTNREYKKYLNWCEEIVVERKNMNPETKNIFTWLLSAEPTKTGANPLPHMGSEARVAITAGSDTTAATLIVMFFYLAKEQHLQTKLQEEVDELYSAHYGDEGKFFEALALGDCPNTNYLEGVIHEALRIYAVVPGSPQRMAPPEGLTIDGTFVPGGTAIYLSQYTTARDPRYFEKPTEFIPERWYMPEKYPLTHKQKVFIPFWTGTWSCVGKPYAYMQLRLLTTRMMRKYSMVLAEGTDEEKIYRDALGQFVLYMGPVDLVLTERDMKE